MKRKSRKNQKTSQNPLTCETFKCGIDYWIAENIFTSVSGRMRSKLCLNRKMSSDMLSFYHELVFHQIMTCDCYVVWSNQCFMLAKLFTARSESRTDRSESEKLNDPPKM